VNVFDQLLAVSEIFFQLTLLVFLLRTAAFRKYLVFSLYILALLAADVVEFLVYDRSGRASPAYRKLYWTDHITLDLLLVLVVITFTYQALGESPLRRKAGKVLGVIAAAAIALPFSMLHNHHTKQYGFFSSQWFNHVSQILNFGAAIMNLVLWAALISNRRRDSQLAMSSIGLGILTSSAAIAWGARQWLSEENRWPIDMFMTVAQIVSVVLWCWVFRPKARRPTSSAPPEALTTPS
jgi:hypothetical protein